MEVHSRRSRMRRARGKQRIAITPRDIRIFKLLASYRYLRSTYLDAFVGSRSEKRFKERLGDLYHEGFLDRPEQQWERVHSFCRPAVYELAEGGHRALAELGEGAGAARTFQDGRGRRQFQHTLAICDVLASIELGTHRTANIRFIPWGEILFRAPDCTRRTAAPNRIPVSGEGQLFPDALFGLEYLSQGKQFYQFCALEVDRATMPVSRTDRTQYSFGQKLETYVHALRTNAYKSHLGVSKLFVLTLTTNATHMVAMMNQLRAGDMSGSFLFRAIDCSFASRILDRPETALIVEPWHRVDSSALAIGAL